MSLWDSRAMLACAGDGTEQIPSFSKMRAFKERVAITMRPEEVESAALQLQRTARAQLAERLIARLDEEDEIEQAWNAEIERRVREVGSDEVTLSPGKQIMDRIRGLLR